MKKTAFILITLVTGLQTVKAEISLPPIIGDGMVLQQNSDARIWGKASPGATIEISSDWCSTVWTTSAGEDGRWLLPIRTPEGSMFPRTITITENMQRGRKSSETLSIVTLHDILIGEVWLCSGQSNMEMPLDGFWDCPVEGSAEEIAMSGNLKGLRMATIPKTGTLSPAEDVQTTWKVAGPENSGRFSAAGYHFAKTLINVLHVPVGIISCCWGGSMLEGWLPLETVSSYPDISTDFTAPSDGNWDAHTPSVMYNGMLHPLRNYTVRGFLWYQGESNVGRHSTYAARLGTMVSQWREIWGLGELPFYIVEIAPYIYGGDGTAGARLREAQQKAASEISGCGIITTNDLVYSYEGTQIHPCRKEEVGQRLAFLALNRTYGLESIVCEGPVFRNMDIKGNEAYIYFDNDDSGFSPWYDIKGFEIAAEDKVFHKAEAKVLPGKKCIVVSSKHVTAPAAVRYCFRDFCPGNLTGSRNFPVFPFRTDNWE